MKYSIILLLLLISCTKQQTINLPDCTIEVEDKEYQCDKDNHIKLTPIENGVKINTTPTDRVNIYHNGLHHSAIITNGTICHNQSVSSTKFKEGDTITVNIDNIAKTIKIKHHAE